MRFHILRGIRHLQKPSTVLFPFFVLVISSCCYIDTCHCCTAATSTATRPSLLGVSPTVEMASNTQASDRLPSSYSNNDLIQWFRLQQQQNENISLSEDALESFSMIGLTGREFLELTEEDLIESEELVFTPTDRANIITLQQKFDEMECPSSLTKKAVEYQSPQALAAAAAMIPKSHPSRHAAAVEMDGIGMAGLGGASAPIYSPLIVEEDLWIIPCVSMDLATGDSFFTTKSFEVSWPEASSDNSIGALSSIIPTAGMILRETPAEYDFDWHCAPRRQFIINLDAAVEVEVTSGEKRLFPAGSMFLVEDIEGKGHRSRAVDGRSRKSIFVGIPDDFHL